VTCAHGLALLGCAVGVRRVWREDDEDGRNLDVGRDRADGLGARLDLACTLMGTGCANQAGRK